MNASDSSTESARGSGKLMRRFSIPKVNGSGSAAPSSFSSEARVRVGLVSAMIRSP